MTTDNHRTHHLSRTSPLHSNARWLDWALQMQGIAQCGLTYTQSMYERERYEELRELSFEIMATYTEAEMVQIRDLFVHETGYATPKIDIRGTIFRDGKLLMVRERMDGKWSLPGGWADIGLSPTQNVIKEVKEEAGLDVRPVKLLAALDKKFHPHPPAPFHIYKYFYLCEVLGGEPSPGLECLDIGFFGPDELPELSIQRITTSQLEMLFAHLNDPDRPTDFD